MAVDMLAHADFPMDRVKLVINHPSNIHRVDVKQVSEVTNCQVFWSVPFDKAIVSGSQAGTPIVMSKPNSRGARSMIDLALAISGGKRERKMFGRTGNVVVAERESLVPATQGGHE
jgi:MinD-like ATPase involved in chromosome partitioning or flagellar assembly